MVVEATSLELHEWEYTKLETARIAPQRCIGERPRTDRRALNIRWAHPT